MDPVLLSEGGLPLEAGRLCLEFANTAEWHASQQPVESLNSYADLVGWAKDSGAIPAITARRLLEEAGRRPSEAQQVLVRAIALREAMYRLFTAIAHNHAPDNADLAQVNAELASASAHQTILPSAEGYQWGWSSTGEDLDQPLWPAVRSAADLLTSAQLARVGQCADDRGCGWLFIDNSRNHSRRWCGMAGCGNRAKARRHYERKRQSETAERAHPASG
jgi:predicted RNA-binding Zn ribbon-like protein